MKKLSSKLIEIQNLDLSEFDLPSLQNLTNEINRNVKKFEFKKNIKISVSSNYTTSFFVKILNVLLINKKISAEIIETEFDSLKFDTIDFSRKIWKSKSDFLFFMPSHLNLLFPPKLNDSKQTSDPSMMDMLGQFSGYNSPSPLEV